MTKIDDLKKIGKGTWRHKVASCEADKRLKVDSAELNAASNGSDLAAPLNRSVLKRKAFSHACSSIKNVLCDEGTLDPVEEEGEDAEESNHKEEHTSNYEEAKSLLQLRSNSNHEYDNVDDTPSLELAQSESTVIGEGDEKCTDGNDPETNSTDASKPPAESVAFPVDVTTTPNPIGSRHFDALSGNIMSTAEYEREVMEMGPVFDFSPYPEVSTNRLDALVNMAELVGRVGSSRVKALPIRPPQFVTRPQFSPIVMPASQEKPSKSSPIITSNDCSAAKEPEQLAAPHIISSPTKIRTTNNVEDLQLSWKSTGTFTFGALEGLPEELPCLTADHNILDANL